MKILSLLLAATGVLFLSSCAATKDCPSCSAMSGTKACCTAAAAKGMKCEKCAATMACCKEAAAKGMKCEKCAAGMTKKAM